MSRKTLVFILMTIAMHVCKAQEQWPRTLDSKEFGKFTVYEPQLDQLQGNILTGRSAISLKKTSGADPFFGAVWFKANMETDRSTRMALINKIDITDIRLPEVKDSLQLEQVKKYLENEVQQWKFNRTLDDISTELKMDQQNVSDEFKNDAPRIVYTKTPSVLILIDGQPKWQNDEQLKMPRIINSAFLFLQYPKDKKYYLRGASSWYVSDSLLKGWKAAKKLPKELQEIDKQIKQQSPDQKDSTSETAPAVVIATEPSELIQTKGEASFAPIDSTRLLYVTNSEDDIFMHTSNSNLYVLISGRWYSSKSLSGAWAYTPGDQLPADFRKIPRGSKKDIVLASVPGTDEAHDAVIDAQIPQTAKVDRSNATCTVKYDGTPVFEQIEGTNLSVAKNTSSTVLKASDGYYCVENGVWFFAEKPDGPWKVSDIRPKDVDKIPASNPSYNVKYVYIYETTPQYVYVGYTPGYMGCYVAGPVVIYGTGYYYYPWYGAYYYPRPVTYGFSMHYNPYTGWHLGFHYSSGFFSFHVWVGGHPGYWGPPIYRPPYYMPYRGGMYGPRGPVYVNRNVNIHVHQTNNIYLNQRGVATNDIKRNNPPNTPGNNNIVSDRNGNVYQRSNNGGWNNKSGSGPAKSQGPSTNEVNKDWQNRQRGNQLNQNFDRTRKSR